MCPSSNEREIDGRNANEWYIVGENKRKEKDFIRAVVAYDNAIQINPQFAEARNNKGYVLGELRRTMKQ